MTKAAELAKMGEVITNSKISGRRNLVLNGSMQVAQRGTSATVASYGTVDRFTFPFDGSNSITQSQGTLSSSDSPYADGFRHYARNTNTNTSSGTGTYAGIKTIIESQDMAQSGWEYTSTSSTVTIQFWARSSVAGTYYMNLRSDDTTAKNFTIPVALTADTWKKITATVIGNSGLVFNNDNGAGLSMIMWMHLGTDYTTSGHTTNAWQTNSGSDQAPDYSIDWRNTSAATFDLTGIQLEVGSQATPFEHRSFGEELALCYRYFQYHVSTSTAARYYADQYSSGTLVLDKHHSPMRAVATGTVIGTWTISNITGQPSLYVGTEHSHYLARPVSSTGRAYFYAGQNDGVSLDAEL